MKAVLFVVLAVWVTCIVADDSLECYSCVNCKDSLGTKEKCNMLENSCIKVEVAGVVARKCGVKHLCLLNKEERQTDNAWDEIKKLFSGQEEKDEDEQSVYCCQDSLCNGASMKHSSVFFAAMPVIFVTLLRF